MVRKKSINRSEGNMNMMRMIALVAVAMAFAVPVGAQTADCAGKMAQMKPSMASVDAKMKDGLNARWGQAEAAMAAKDEAACLSHLAFIEKALKEGKM